ncbi:hypothetical protein M758_9G181100 [Ceratodon purpureus]|nr:hypothetical protein M758_9G181100 [Ceratodon purpureus]
MRIKCDALQNIIGLMQNKQNILCWVMKPALTMDRWLVKIKNKFHLVVLVAVLGNAPYVSKNVHLTPLQPLYDILQMNLR